MKKNVIALAVAAAMAAPLAAQAEVNVSGTLQAELVNWTGDRNAEGLYLTDGQTYGNAKGSGAGTLAFTASEDLGGGMKALAKYSFNIQADDATQGTREAYLGLTGGFGTVLAGNMSSPYKTSTVKWDPFYTTFAQARGNGGMSNSGYANGGYLSNAVAYANKFGPAKFAVAISLDEVADPGATPANSSTVGKHAYTASVNVPVGPIEVAFAVLNASDMGVSSAAGTLARDRMQTKLGVKYSAGPVTAAVQAETSDVSVEDGMYTYVTGSYVMGANTFSASYGNYSADATVDPAVNVGTPAWGANDASYTAIGVKHAFSKSTSVYAAYRSTTVDVAAGVAKRDEDALGVGMRMNF